MRIPHGDVSTTSNPRSRHFWCRGYYVDTVGKNKKAIEEYIRSQLVEDEMMDQITMKEYTDPFTGSKNSKA